MAENYEADFQNDDQPSVKQFNVQTDVALQKPDKKEQQEQRYEEDFNDYKPENGKQAIRSTPDREKMIEQNIKLKTQIFQLAKQMDGIMSKEKAKKKYGIHAGEEDNEAIRGKKDELNKQHVEILQLKNKIYLTKRQLQHVYDSRGIQGKEDQLKNLEIKLKVLRDEKDGLIQIKKEQTRALNIVKDGDEYEEKVRTLKQQQSKLRDDCKILTEKVTESQRILRKNHEQYVIKHNRVKEMEQKIKENKERSRKNNHSNIVTNEMVSDIDQQINEQERERKESQKVWGDKIHAAETEFHQRKNQEEKKLLILKQRERELKISQIRIKELKKLITHHKHESNSPKKSGKEELDMKQYRYKRNIKYLEKK